MNTTENTCVYTVMSIAENTCPCPSAMNTMEKTCIYIVLSIVEHFGLSIAISTMRRTDLSAFMST